MLPEVRKREYFTTARIISSEMMGRDWLWINTNTGHEFQTEEGAQTIADLSNANGAESGLDVSAFPYFVVKVTRSSVIECVPEPS